MEKKGHKKKVVIVEDEVLIARHISEILVDGGYHVLGIIHTGEQAVDYILSQKPDIVLMDIHLDGQIDGIDVAHIVNQSIDVPIIFVTAFSDVGILDRAKKATPAGYIVKPFKPTDLLTSIAIGTYNHSFLRRKEELTVDKVNDICLSPLSPTEFAILLDIKEGFTNSQIAKRSNTAISTVKWHVKNIYTKLEVKNRTSAVKRITQL